MTHLFISLKQLIQYTNKELKQQQQKAKTHSHVH